MIYSILFYIHISIISKRKNMIKNECNMGLPKLGAARLDVKTPGLTGAPKFTGRSSPLCLASCRWITWTQGSAFESSIQSLFFMVFVAFPYIFCFTIFCSLQWTIHIIFIHVFSVSQWKNGTISPLPPFLQPPAESASGARRSRRRRERGPRRSSRCWWRIGSFPKTAALAKPDSWLLLVEQISEGKRHFENGEKIHGCFFLGRCWRLWSIDVSGYRFFAVLYRA